MKRTVRSLTAELLVVLLLLCVSCKSVPFPETSPEELYREEPRRVDVAPGEMPEPQTPGEEP
ncbi:MAG: hypothetical protein LBC60_12785, partial [Spirochaetaceae bacterium]|nr:hypothetical protein [Spirochaetaceae bacterium]